MLKQVIWILKIKTDNKFIKKNVCFFFLFFLCYCWTNNNLLQSQQHFFLFLKKEIQYYVSIEWMVFDLRPVSHTTVLFTMG